LMRVHSSVEQKRILASSSSDHSSIDRINRGNLQTAKVSKPRTEPRETEGTGRNTQGSKEHLA